MLEPEIRDDLVDKKKHPLNETKEFSLSSVEWKRKLNLMNAKVYQSSPKSTRANTSLNGVFQPLDGTSQYLNITPEGMVQNTNSYVTTLINVK